MILPKNLFFPNFLFFSYFSPWFPSKSPNPLINFPFSLPRGVKCGTIYKTEEISLSLFIHKKIFINLDFTACFFSFVSFKNVGTEFDTKYWIYSKFKNNLLKLNILAFLTMAKMKIKTYWIKACEKILKLSPLFVGCFKNLEKNWCLRQKLEFFLFQFSLENLFFWHHDLENFNKYSGSMLLHFLQLYLHFGSCVTICDILNLIFSF